jgi:hypothetical protein
MSKKYNISAILGLSIIVLYNIVYFLFTLKLTGEDSAEGRLDRLILVLLILVFVFYAVKCRLKKDIRNTCADSIYIFLCAYILCAILSLQNIEVIASYLPTILYVFLSFFFFFYLSFCGKITQKQIVIFYVILTIVSLLAFGKVFLYRSATMSDIYKHSNSTGYLFVLLFPAIALMFKRRMLLTIISFCFMIIILNSAKRGAIIIGGCIVAYILYSNFKFISTKYKILMVFISTILIWGIYCYVQTQPTLFLRFEQEGGSGRNEIYSNLLNQWSEGNSITLLFGNGFFSVVEINESNIGLGLMAHNDWLEVLYDMGLTGFLVYLYMLVSFLRQRPNIKLYQSDMLLSYDLCLIIWIMKSLVSGVLMDKGSLLLFSCLGLIVGFSLKKKYIFSSEKHVK